MHSDLLVATNREGADGVARLGRDGRLAGQLLEDLRRPRQSVARLADADVCAVSTRLSGRASAEPDRASARDETNQRLTDHELLDPQILHRVGRRLLLGHG